jgi:hypothetical protein
MTRTRSRSSSAVVRRLAGFAAAALLTATAAGCTAAGYAPAPVGLVSTPDASGATGLRIVLRFDRAAVPATLSDTAASRELASLLPLTLDLRDPMGQAKSGRLPVPLNASDVAVVTDPEAGCLYYVPDSQLLAVFYDDLGQAVPTPGLIRLGTVDGDLTAIAAAGNRVWVRVDLADATGS